MLFNEYGELNTVTLVIVIVVVCLLVGIGGYVWWTNNKNTPAPALASNQSALRPT